MSQSTQNENELSFTFSDEPSCIPDWHLPSGNSLFVDFVNCDDSPTCDDLWIDQSGENVQVNFSDCDLDWVDQLGSNIQVNFNGGSSSNGDWKETVGNQANIDFNCCEDTPVGEIFLVSGRVLFDQINVVGDLVHTTRYSASGMFNTYQIAVDGFVHQATDIHNVWGDCQFNPITVIGAVQRGNRVHGRDGLGFGAIAVVGDVYTIPSGAFTAVGDVKINQITVQSNVQHIQARYVSGDTVLRIGSTGRIDIPYDVSGLYNTPQIQVIGDVRTHITEVSGDCRFDEIKCDGAATFTLVPTVSNTNVQLEQIKSTQIGGDPVGIGNHVYWANFRLEINVSGTVVTPYEVSGDSTLDNITVAGTVIVDDERPVYDGVLVYPTFTRLRIGIDSEIIHPFHVNGECKFDDIIVNGSTLATNIVTSNISVPQIRSNGNVAAGIDSLQIVIEQLYEISTNQSMDILEYPKTAKFPVYVPTTMYNIETVELRRGTVNYTVSSQVERDIISKIILWIMDENGVATKDTYVTFKNEQTVPYEIDIPYHLNFGVSIPLHCVTNKKNKFFLEIIYDNIEDGNGVSVVDRNSRVVEFQAHYDNRGDFINATDRFRVTSSSSANTEFVTQYTISGRPVEYRADDRFTYDINSSVNEEKLISSYRELGTITLNDLETRFIYDQNEGFAVYYATYYELDTGQIGG